MSLPVLNVELWENLRRELVWIRRGVIEAQHRDGQYQPRGAIAAWRIIKGRVRFDLDTGSLVAGPGQWIFPGLGRGRRSFSDGSEIISIRFIAQWPNEQALYDHGQSFRVAGKSFPLLDKAGFNLVDFVQGQLSPRGFFLPSTQVDYARYLELRTHTEAWFRAYIGLMSGRGQQPREPVQLDKRIREAKRIMGLQLKAGMPMTEAEVARDVGLSLSQFKRLFGRDMKKTPKSWLDERRNELACDRLSETAESIKQIGYGLGFRSPNHFSSWFRLRNGCTPGEFRKNR